MKMNFSFLVRVLCLSGVLLAACRRPADEPPSEELPLGLDPVDALFEEVDMLLVDGQSQAAHRLLVDALANPALAVERSRIFNLLIRFLIHNNDLDQAKARLLAMLRTDPDVALASLNEIGAHLQQDGDIEHALVWSDTLLGVGLDVATRTDLMRNRIELEARHGKADALPAVLQRIWGEFETDTATSLGRLLFEGLVANRRFDAIETLLPVLEDGLERVPGLRPLHMEMSVRVLIQQTRWPEATAALDAALATLSDTVLSRLFRSLADGMRRDNAWQALDATCKRLLESDIPHVRLLDAVARQWLQLAAEHHGPDAISERIRTLQLRDFDPQMVYALYSRHYYATIDHADALREMLEIGDRLMTTLPQEHQRANLRMLTLDGSFIIEDYARSIALIEEGIPGRDAAWHAMALTKLKAHQAIVDGRHLEAVAHLRAFMDALRESPEETTPDPVTGILHTRDMLLGRNSLRVGELFGKTGETAAAAEAYAEARAYYRNAVQALGLDSPSGRLAQEELQSVPGGAAPR